MPLLPPRLTLLLSAVAAALSAVAVDLPGPYDRLAVALIAGIGVLVQAPKKDPAA